MAMPRSNVCCSVCFFFHCHTCTYVICDPATRCYIEDRLKVGEEMTVTPSGLHLMPSKSYLGASSDGLVLCSNVDTLCQGCMEVKCPYSILLPSACIW